MSNLWEVEEAHNALKAYIATDDRSYLVLCSRYLEKALERIRCVYCHEALTPERPYKPHFKGFVHWECAEKYSSRGDYESKHQSS